MSSDNTGVPIKLLVQGEGHIVTVEMKNGEVYRGLLAEAEETMNCQLKEVTMTHRDGRVVKLENVFLRGGNIKFIVLPDLLRNSPALKKVQVQKAKKIGDEVPTGKKAGGMGAGAKRQKTA